MTKRLQSEWFFKSQAYTAQLLECLDHYISKPENKFPFIKMFLHNPIKNPINETIIHETAKNTKNAMENY